MGKVAIAIGEPVHRFNLGQSQMTTKMMMLAAGGAGQSLHPGQLRAGAD